MTPPDDPYRAMTPMDEPVRAKPLHTVSQRRIGAGALPAAILGFVVGGASVGWLVWHGDLARMLPQPITSQSAVAAPRTSAETGQLETRLALLEDRIARIDQQAGAAAGNAGRAEGLLIAQASRRAIERGRPLGPLADQLRLHFADTQPRAVETLIAFSQRPVTLSALDAQLNALTPQLANRPRETTSWTQVRTALAGLFTIRSDAEPTLQPEERISRAKLLLADGQTDAATAMVTRLPGGAAAGDWTEDARRYAAAQLALDTIESAALSAPPTVTRQTTAVPDGTAY